MKRKPCRKEKRRIGKTILRLPDLEVAKSAVLNSLSCPDAQRGYRHAIDEFVDWYCSEPRLSFSKTVVVRTGCTWKPAISPQAQSISVSGPSAGWHTRRQIAVSLAPTWLREYGGSRA